MSDAAYLAICRMWKVGFPSDPTDSNKLVLFGLKPTN